MGSKWGKCIKQQCAMLLIFNSMAHCHDRSMLSRMGNPRAAMGTFSVSSRYRWPCLRICGIHGSQITARCKLELTVIAHLVNEQAQCEIYGVHPCGCLLQQVCSVHGLSSCMWLMSAMMLSAIPLRRSTSTSRNSGLKQYTQKHRSSSCCHS